MKNEDFIGRRYGQLLVIGLDRTNGLLVCQCDCGMILRKSYRTIADSRYHACGNCLAKIQTGKMHLGDLPQKEMPSKKTRESVMVNYESGQFEHHRSSNRGTLCWHCAKSCGNMGWCSWSREFKPVDGWEAKSHILSNDISHHGKMSVRKLQSYKVVSCPEFVRG